jgi:MinD-like ATPase involved in chromosome partitioning or flagellar assembly
VTLVAVVGDVTTTTAVALAAGWPTVDGAVVLEADPSGGALAAWLDTTLHPSLATVVAAIGHERDHRSALATFDSMVRRSRSGIRFVPNMIRARAAQRAVEEAATGLAPVLAAAGTTVLADTGRHVPGSPVPSVRSSADLVLVVHRQSRASTAAATVHVERLVETIEDLTTTHAPVVLAVVGSRPFDVAEIGAFVGQATNDALTATVEIADDPLAAATLAGRAGVSAKRLRRLPLMRSASALARLLDDLASAEPVAAGHGNVAGGSP